jgi:CHAT domain-containing protein
MMGLRRSFLLAGASAVIVSLWSVGDDMTCSMMEGFYKRLVRKMPRAEALAAARHAIRATHPSPRDWGAFVCFGATNSLGPGAP